MLSAASFAADGGVPTKVGSEWETGFAASKLFEHRRVQAVSGKTLGYENVFSKPGRGISR